MIKVELKLQPEGEPKKVDGLLWGGKEPVQFQFDWRKPDELRCQNETYVLHRFGKNGFPKSIPVEIIKITRTSIKNHEDLIEDHFDLLAATVLNRGNMLGDNLSVREVAEAKYRVIYANNEDLYLSGLERLAPEPKKAEATEGKKVARQPKPQTPEQKRAAVKRRKMPPKLEKRVLNEMKQLVEKDGNTALAAARTVRHRMGLPSSGAGYTWGDLAEEKIPSLRTLTRRYKIRFG